MKTLSAALLTEQKKATAMPAISLVARQYGHPAKAELIQPGMYGWTQLYSGGETPYYHGVAIPGDGSLIRARTTTTPRVQIQRVTSPGPASNYAAAWTDVLATVGVAPCAIAANGAEVSVFGSYFGTALPDEIHHNQSDDNGATWNGETTALPANAAAVALAAAYKSNGDLCIVGSHSGAANLWACVRTSGSWGSVYAKSSPPTIEWLTMYYDGDWNIIALVQDGYGFLRLASIIFGAGNKVAANSWGSFSYLDTAGKATYDSYQLMSQYFKRNYLERAYLPYQPRISRYQRNPYRTVYNRYKWYLMTGLPVETYSRAGEKGTGNWEAVSNIAAARAIDNLDLDAPFICKPSGAPPILSAIKIAERWFFRLQPGGTTNDYFYLDEWYKAHKEAGSCTYGLALASDGTYLWGTRINEVWRTKLPGSCWDTPTIGTGPNASSQAIPQADILDLEETIRDFDTSELKVTLDNSAGTYSSLPGTHIKRGSQVELAIGYRAPTDELAAANKYFIEDYTYDRAPNQAAVTLYCIDAWGLLEQYVIPGYQEYNLMSDTHSVYDLISKLMACIGGTLTYVSRSTAITSTYPKLELQPGETGAGLLRRLLELVPDVIYFNGLTGYIVYPQDTDQPCYSYTFPEGA